jgi:hypothetical protein
MEQYDVESMGEAPAPAPAAAGAAG